MGEIIMLAVEIGVESEHPDVLKRARDIRRLHEAEPHLYAVEAMAETLDLMPLAKRYARTALEHVGQEHHAFVKNAIVLEVPDQHWRGAVLDLGQPYPQTWGTADDQIVDIGEKAIERQHRHLIEAPPHLQRSFAPGQHHSCNRSPDDERKPTALDDLERIGHQKNRFDDAEECDDQPGNYRGPVPAPDRDTIKQQRRA